MVIGANRGLLLQVLLATHAFTKANCVVICARGTRFLRFSRLISEYLELDLSGTDDHLFVHHVNRFAETMPDLILIPVDCEGSRLASRVQSQLNAALVPTPDSTMLDCLDNKWRFYQFCRKHGLNTPATCLIGNKHRLDFAATARELGLPFLVKPVNLAGSKGVELIASEQEYQRKILHNDAYRHGLLIAQSYVYGTDVGLNLLSICGKVSAIAIQRRHYPQHEAARISFIPNDYLITVAHTISRASAYQGVMNVDARIEKGSDKVFLLECNPRFWRSVLASAWCGLNFVAETAQASAAQDQARMLTAGVADTFWHPLFRPALWRYALFDTGYRGRMVRAMMSDVCLLGSSIVFKSGPRNLPPGGAYMPHDAGLHLH